MDWIQKVTSLREHYGDDATALPVYVVGDAHLALTARAPQAKGLGYHRLSSAIWNSAWGTGHNAAYSLSALGFCPELLVALPSDPGLSSYVEGRLAEGLDRWKKRWRKSLRMRGIRLPGRCPTRFLLESSEDPKRIEDVGCASGLSWSRVLDCLDLERPGVLFVCSYFGTQLHSGLDEALEDLSGANFLICADLGRWAHTLNAAGGEAFEAQVLALQQNLPRIDILSAGQPELLELYREEMRLSPRRERDPEVVRNALEELLSKKGVAAPGALLTGMRGQQRRLWARCGPSSGPWTQACLDPVTNGAPDFDGVFLAAFVASILTASPGDPIEAQCQEALSVASGALSYALDQCDEDPRTETVRPPLESLVQTCRSTKAGSVP